ncbi:hypothetical protein [Kineococcus rhizosphaerae]|uniref:DUF5666 domain-containing protein n=1 Tax=Kineococcus rhizosphaerae TaxID=559628 RepID=A0A2T0R1E6_9ACTN|nr:hypothetical protein [Kineococcus rhizosphaerae]PRY13351.1 hypothetical protein CLV37_10819 [Kineococcus rhizosphaerae]
MTRRTTTLTLSLALAAAIAVPTAGSAVAARPGTPQPTATSTATSTAPATSTATATATAQPGKGSAPVVTRRVRTPQLVVTGTLKAVDAATGRLTVSVHGGRDKSLRGKDLTVVLGAKTVLRQDGAVVAPAALRTGGHVNVQGARAADGTLSAARVTVESGEDHATDDPTATPTGTPTATATTTPVED